MRFIRQSRLYHLKRMGKWGNPTPRFVEKILEIVAEKGKRSNRSISPSGLISLTSLKKSNKLVDRPIRPIRLVRPM